MLPFCWPMNAAFSSRQKGESSSTPCDITLHPSSLSCLVLLDFAISITSKDSFPPRSFLPHLQRKLSCVALCCYDTWPSHGGEASLMLCIRDIWFEPKMDQCGEGVG